MARKRKGALAGHTKPITDIEEGRSMRYAVDETFDDSEDEFFAGRDKILLEDGPAAKRQRRLDRDGLLNASIR